MLTLPSSKCSPPPLAFPRRLLFFVSFHPLLVAQRNRWRQWCTVWYSDLQSYPILPASLLQYILVKFLVFLSTEDFGSRIWFGFYMLLHRQQRIDSHFTLEFLCVRYFSDSLLGLQWLEWSAEDNKYTERSVWVTLYAAGRSHGVMPCPPPVRQNGSTLKPYVICVIHLTRGFLARGPILIIVGAGWGFQ